MISETPSQQKEKRLLSYRAEMQKELDDILTYWDTHVKDEVNGGYYGSVDNNNNPDPDAKRGIVMYTRICWAFSAGYNQTRKTEWLRAAARAFDYIVSYFVDREYGGVYWAVDTNGKIADGHKQIYGLAFCIYALSEYYLASRDESSLQIAKDMYTCIERYSHDAINGGYIEAFAREWTAIKDLRLSDKDDNERKTTNTHLHIIEAYANLYRAWPDQELRKKIRSLLELFRDHMIGEDGHLLLFFNDQWESRSSLVSFGHDIEAAWLLLDCARVAGYTAHKALFERLAIKLTDAAAEGLDTDGGLWYEADPAINHWIYEKHSWPQAEAMTGFFHAWQITNKDAYLHSSLAAWEFVKRYIRDNKNGEWFWGVAKDYSLMKKDKAGFWKCPYHNTRTCLQLIHRIPE